MKKIFNYIGYGLFYVLFFVLVVILFALFDLGEKWDVLTKNNYDLFSHISLIVFRLTIYILPAIILWALNKRKKKLSFYYSIQFFCYSFILAIYNVGSLDYLLETEIFSKLDSFAFLLGLVLALSFNKKLPKEVTSKFDD